MKNSENPIRLPMNAPYKAAQWSVDRVSWPAKMYVINSEMIRPTLVETQQSRSSCSRKDSVAIAVLGFLQVSALMRECSYAELRRKGGRRAFLAPCARFAWAQPVAADPRWAQKGAAKGPAFATIRLSRASVIDPLRLVAPLGRSPPGVSTSHIYTGSERKQDQVPYWARCGPSTGLCPVALDSSATLLWRKR